jgi:TPR repeat protein
MHHDVFISYTSHDKPTADAICHALEAQGVRCWIAPRDIPLGQNYAETLINAINAAKLMVLVFSGNTNSSRHVRNEVERAFNRDIAVIPFRIEDTQATGALEYFLSMPHWLDAFSPPLQQHLNSLVDSVRALLMAQDGPLKADGADFLAATVRPKPIVFGKSPGRRPDRRRNVRRSLLATTGIGAVLLLIGLTIGHFRSIAKPDDRLSSTTTPAASQPTSAATIAIPPIQPAPSPQSAQPPASTAQSNPPPTAIQPIPSPAPAAPSNPPPLSVQAAPASAPAVQPSVAAAVPQLAPAQTPAPSVQTKKHTVSALQPAPVVQSNASVVAPKSAPNGASSLDKGWIGLALQQVPENIARSLDPADPHGAFVIGVEPGMPAAKAGIKSRDLVLTFDGKPVNEFGDLVRMIIDTQPDKIVGITVLRDRQKIALPVTTTGRQQAAEAGNVSAMRSLGNAYSNGQGATKDYGEAMRWLRKAADRGDADAMNSVGSLYAGGLGVATDYAEAMRWYQKAATLGNPIAMTNVGFLYASGLEVTTDYAEAMGWFQKAAALGNLNAMTNIGGFYVNGQGVTADYAEAMRWYRKAADLGGGLACQGIAMLYTNGLGVPQDDAEALRWYRKAAGLGDKTAKTWLAEHGY